MNTVVPQTSTCTHCNSEMQKKEFKPNELDINTQSLLLMFRIHELVVMECPNCGHKGMYL